MRDQARFLFERHRAHARSRLLPRCPAVGPLTGNRLVTAAAHVYEPTDASYRMPGDPSSMTGLSMLHPASLTRIPLPVKPRIETLRTFAGPSRGDRYPREFRPLRRGRGHGKARAEVRSAIGNDAPVGKSR